MSNLYYDEVYHFLKGKAPLFEKELALLKRQDRRQRIDGSGDVAGRGRSNGGLSGCEGGGDMYSHTPSQY
jgi:hypothetical protein